MTNAAREGDHHKVYRIQHEIEKAEIKLLIVCEMWHKPLISCGTCTSSVWGTALWFILGLWTWQVLLIGIPLCAFVNFVVIGELHKRYNL